MNRDKLREAMKKKGLNMSDVARESGVTKATMSRVLAGKNDCSIRSAAQIRKALNLSMKDTIEIFFEE